MTRFSLFAATLLALSGSASAATLVPGTDADFVSVERDAETAPAPSGELDGQTLQGGRTSFGYPTSADRYPVGDRSRSLVPGSDYYRQMDNERERRSID